MKINIKKSALAFLLTTSIALTQTNAYAQMTDKRDCITTTTELNVRLDNTTDSARIYILDEGTTVYRILSCDNNWDLIRYGDIIGYVCRDYIKEEWIQDPIEYTHTEKSDLVYTTTGLNFRLEPSTEGQKIETIKKNEEAELLAETSTGWYLIKYHGRIGYVKAEYTKTLSQIIKEKYPYLDITSIEVMKTVYATSDVNVRQSDSIDSERIGELEKYESAIVLQETNDWYLIKSNDYIGYVNKSYTKELEGTFVIIDLSDQELVLYKENDIILTTNVTTGKNSSPTNKGLFKIKDKERSRYLVGEDYKSYVEYWMPFDGGIGLHDASWRKKFGGDIYKKKGSHGCVNLPVDIAPIIYENVKVGTKVLVHK